MPVLLSQVLYYLESNTRSATVIGAIVSANWPPADAGYHHSEKLEEVTYYLALIVLMVMVMDFISGKIRSWLIQVADSQSGASQTLDEQPYIHADCQIVGGTLIFSEVGQGSRLRDSSLDDYSIVSACAISPIPALPNSAISPVLFVSGRPIIR